MDRWSEYTFFQRRYISGQQLHENMFNITNNQGHANQNQWDIITLYSLKGLSRGKRQEISVGEDVEKREHLCTVDGKCKLNSYYRKHYGLYKEH